MATARCSLSTEIMTGQRLEQACTAELIDGSVILLRQLELSDAEDILALYESLDGRGTLLSLLRDASGAPRGLGAINYRTQRRPILTWRVQCRQAARRSQCTLHVENSIRRDGRRGGTRRTPSRRRYRAAAPTRRHREDKRAASSRCRGALGKPPHASGAFGDRLAMHPTPRGFGATRRDRPWRGAPTS